MCALRLDDVGGGEGELDSRRGRPVVVGEGAVLVNALDTVPSVAATLRVKSNNNKIVKLNWLAEREHFTKL